MAAPALDADALYEEIRKLPVSEQLRLVSRIAEGVAQNARPPRATPRLTDLEGLGAEVWQGIDAAAYVRALRDEWDDRR